MTKLPNYIVLFLKNSKYKEPPSAAKNQQDLKIMFEMEILVIIIELLRFKNEDIEYADMTRVFVHKSNASLSKISQFVMK